MTDRELMQQALEALEQSRTLAPFGAEGVVYWEGVKIHDAAITALRERLVQPEGCQCPACKATPHTSDCAVHNEPAYPKGACNCVAQLEQKPVAYDKTELNCFAQDLYDQKMREGKRGHYESMFHVIHQCIKKVAPPQRKPLTNKEIWQLVNDCSFNRDLHADKFARAIEAAHGIKEST